MRKIFAAELLFIMIFCFIDGGKGLNCFECRSDVNDGCYKSVNQSHSVACPTKPNTTQYCRKITQLLKFKDQKDYTIIRECAYSKGTRACYFYKWVALAYQETCECDSDLCNRGTSFAPDYRTLTLLIFSVWIFNYLVER